MLGKLLDDYKIVIDEIRIDIITFIREKNITSMKQFVKHNESDILIERLAETFRRLKYSTECRTFLKALSLDYAMEKTTINALLWNGVILAMSELGFDLKDEIKNTLEIKGKSWVERNASSEVKMIFGIV